MLKNIDQLEEQDIAKKILKIYLNSYPPPLLILHGPPGVGKWSTADAFIHQFLCESKKACGLCKPCRKLLQHQYADYIRFPEDKVKIGDSKNPEAFTIRWLLQKRISYTPLDGKTRFVLFPQGENIQHEAEAALLKTLEEAPAHTRFIIIVNNLNNLKETIVSRGICIPFFLLSDHAVSKITKSQDDDILKYLGGSLNNASLLDTDFYKKMTNKITEALEHPLELIQLEKWLIGLENPKSTARKEHKLDLSYNEILEFFSLVLLIKISQSTKANKYAKTEANIETNMETNYKLIASIFNFKEGLQLQMKGFESYLLSYLFAKIHKHHFSK